MRREDDDRGAQGVGTRGGAVGEETGVKHDCRLCDARRCSPPPWLALVVGVAMIGYCAYHFKTWRDGGRTARDILITSLLLLVGAVIMIYGAILWFHG